MTQFPDASQDLKYRFCGPSTPLTLLLQKVIPFRNTQVTCRKLLRCSVLSFVLINIACDYLRPSNPHITTLLMMSQHCAVSQSKPPPSPKPHRTSLLNQHTASMPLSDDITGLLLGDKEFGQETVFRRNKDIGRAYWEATHKKAHKGVLTDRGTVLRSGEEK